MPGATLEVESRRLAGVLERRGFAGSACVVAVPHEMLLSAVLELPPRISGAPVALLAAAELARRQKCDPGSMEVSLWEIPAANRAASGCEYMVTACAHETANPFLDAFEDAGLDVLALDVPQLALLRACAGEVRPPPAMDALLHVGYDRCSLMIVTDGVIAYERALEGAEGSRWWRWWRSGSALRAARVEEILSGHAAQGSGAPGGPLSELEAELRDFTVGHVASLVEQINTSFSYISRRYTDRDLTTVLLTGEFGGLPGLAARVTTLGVEARVFGSGDCGGSAGRRCGRAVGPGDHRGDGAGDARRARRRMTITSANLIPRSRLAAQRVTARIRLWSGVLVVYAALLAGGYMAVRAALGGGRGGRAGAAGPDLRGDGDGQGGAGEHARGAHGRDAAAGRGAGAARPS